MKALGAAKVEIEMRSDISNADKFITKEMIEAFLETLVQTNLIKNIRRMSIIVLQEDELEATVKDITDEEIKFTNGVEA